MDVCGSESAGLLSMIRPSRVVDVSADVGSCLPRFLGYSRPVLDVDDGPDWSVVDGFSEVSDTYSPGLLKRVWTWSLNIRDSSHTQVVEIRST